MEKLNEYHDYAAKLNIDSFVNEFLKTLNTDSLMNLSKESEGPTFEENSLIRELISLYGISTDFHTGLIGLRSLMLTEIARRHYSPVVMSNENSNNTLKSVEELYANEFPKFTQSYTLMNNASYESFDEIKVCNHQTKFSDGRATVKNASINITRNLETTRIILSPESVKHLIEALQNIDRIILK